MADGEALNIGLVGFGTVGSGVARIFAENSEQLAIQAGRPLSIRRVVVRDTSRSRDFLPPGAILSDSIDDVANDPAIDLVVQLIGGIHPARGYMEQCLKAGKDIVTANKALLYEHGDELFRTAFQGGRTIGFEAAVAGGIPIVAAISQSMTGNRIHSIEAILNGTSNFILTRMLDHRQSYQDVLKEAQELGYAEADPSMDVDGTDAAQKLSILSDLAFATPVRLHQIVRQGIEQIQLLDLQVAAELGYRIKLLAVARKTDGALEVSVQPTLVAVHRSIAQTSGADNMVALRGNAVGRLALAGPGAGQLPTASAVVADIVDCATGRAKPTFASLNRNRNQPACAIQPPEQLRRQYYLRFNVDDRPHVLADITDVLGRNEVSLLSVRQDPAESESTSRLVMMTHQTSEGQIRKAAGELARLSCMHDSGIQLPVVD